MLEQQNNVSHLILKGGAKDSLRNLLYLPLRTLVWSDKQTEDKGLRSLRVERFRAIWPYLEGQILDIGSHDNTLINNYKAIEESSDAQKSLGIDVIDYGGGTMIVDDTSKLPFENNSFDTASMLASLNYIPNKTDALYEIFRVLNDNGTIIISQPQPQIAKFIFFVKRLLKKQPMAGEPKQNGKVSILTRKEIIDYCEPCGFQFTKEVRFNMGTNCIYIFSKKHNSKT